MNLVKPKIAHYKAVMEADRDFERAGEEPYCGASGRVGYMAGCCCWTGSPSRECMDYGSNPNEIYFLMDDEEKKDLRLWAASPLRHGGRADLGRPHRLQRRALRAGAGLCAGAPAPAAGHGL